MRKGQSFIIEFILFFAISFSVFSTISFYFYNQSNYFKKIVGEKACALLNDFVSIDLLTGITCKSCDSILILDEIPSRIGGYYYKVSLDTTGLNTTLISAKLYSEHTSIFRLNETFSLSGESKSENKKIEIKINNTESTIEVE